MITLTPKIIDLTLKTINLTPLLRTLRVCLTGTEVFWDGHFLYITSMVYFTFQAMKNGQKLDEDENRATREEIREKFNEIKQENLKQ